MLLRHTVLRSLLVGIAAMAVVAPATAARADPTPAQIQAQIDKGNSDVELIVASRPEIFPADERQVVRIGRMEQGIVVGEERAPPREAAKVGLAQDCVVVLILEQDDEDVLEPAA